jgi:hypothetical protein
MSWLKIIGTALVYILAAEGAADATPVTTLKPLNSNGTEMFAVYVFSEAADTLNLSEIAPNTIPNIFCDHSNGGCTASSIGQIIDLGLTDPGIVFSLTDITVHNTFRTDAFAADGYAHSLISNTVDASNAAAVAAAYNIFGQGTLLPAAATSIALLGQTPDTVVTFVGWEDRLRGDYDYNDLIFAFTDPPREPTNVPEPETLAIFTIGLVGFGMFRRSVLRSGQPQP